VIKTADWIVDVGPEAGADGGWVVAEGTPEEIADSTRWPRHTYTGELLAPLLQRDQRAELELFDAKAVSRKKQGDLEIDEVGKSTRMPWQTDGRRWHLETRLTHVGTPCRWEGPALEAVIRQIEAHGAFVINWSERSIVDVRATESRKHWFLHAMTGDEWILKLKFRVPGAPFKQDRLAKELAMTSFDDIDEVPVYGRADRVQVKRLEAGWQEIEISVHWLREIDTPAFRQFLQKALEVYSGQKAQGGTAGEGKPPKPRSAGRTVPRTASSENGDTEPTTPGPDEKKTTSADKLADETPWKKLGRGWHEKRKGFPVDATIAWPTDVVVLLLDAVEQAFPDETWSFDAPECARMILDNRGTVSVYTKRPEGVDLEWRPLAHNIRPLPPAAAGKPGPLTLEHVRNGMCLRFTSPKQVTDIIPYLLRMMTMPQTGS